jgi:hypothetical protein
MGVAHGLFAVREEHKLQMFENKVLRKVFGPKKVEVNSFLLRFFVMRNSVIYI